MPPKYIKKIGTTYPHIYTEGLWARGDMIPCDEHGRSLSRAYDDGEATDFPANDQNDAVLPSGVPDSTITGEVATDVTTKPEVVEPEKDPDAARQERIDKIVAEIPRLKPEDFRKGAVPMPKIEPLINAVGDENIALDDVREAWSRYRKTGAKKDAGSEL